MHNSHIDTLIRNGVRIKYPDGTTAPLTHEHYEQVMRFLNADNAAVAYTYAIELPEIDENFLLVIFKDGRVYSGSEDMIRIVLGRVSV